MPTFNGWARLNSPRPQASHVETLRGVQLFQGQPGAREGRHTFVVHFNTLFLVAVARSSPANNGPIQHQLNAETLAAGLSK
jgi:hypothetical protein